MYSIPSGQAMAMSTNAPSRIATDMVLTKRTTDSTPSPTASFDVAALSSSLLAGAVVAVAPPASGWVGAAAVVGVWVAIVKRNEPLPPGVPSGLLTFQPTAHSPLLSAPVTGTVSVS